MQFGAHVSIAKGIFNAPLNAAAIGAEAFQIFTRSPHGGPVAPITPDHAALFKKNCELVGITEWVVHAPYYINYASANNRVRFGSISAVRQELDRASAIGAKYVMAHLGSYSDLGRDAGFGQVIEGLRKTLDSYENSAEFLIEISAGSGNVIGDTFEELAEIIFNPKLKKFKIGVCYDTQHAFASGYDERNAEALEKTLEKFDKILGLDRFKMSHCNDSKVPLGAQRDRHEHIGKGYIGLEGFEAIVKNPKLRSINFFCETEHDLVKEDLLLLKTLRDKK